MPRVILGSPVFNHVEHVGQALESIRNQTFTDFAMVLVDDGSSDGTYDIVRQQEAMDTRLWSCRNSTRLGLIDNSRKAFALARQRHPEAEYFAWISDHDVWHPRWLEELVGSLDAHPQAVLAYPLNRRVDSAGALLRRKPWRFDTLGVANRWRRLPMAIVRMRAGNMVYGLYRVGVLQRAGVYRKIVVPDRLLLAELSLYGQFSQVAEVLWYRRWYGRVFSLERQRASFFPDAQPLYAYCPWWLSHPASLFWSLAARGDGRPDVSRASGACAATLYLGLAGPLHAWQTLRAIRGWIIERMTALRRRARSARRMIARGTWSAK